MIHDVVIAGAGPVGLFLACELRLAGVSVLVLEAGEHPGSPLKRPPFGLRGLSAPTQEALDRRGLLADVAAAAQGAADGAHWRRQSRASAGHFAGIQIHDDRVDTTGWPYRLTDAAGPALAVAMEALESVLATRARALGAEIRRGCSVDGLEMGSEMIAVHAGGDRLEGRWLVGCDGGRSTVRKAAGFGFAGTAPEFTGYSVEVTLADASLLPPGRRYTAAGMYTFTPPGTVAMVEFDGGAFHRSEPITREHVQAVLQRVSGERVEVTDLKLAATWTDRAFQADTYRRGRVLLAGDAAHIHSPLGGQGLNLGLGDAVNLGWKLAATIHGRAPAGLLDSYDAERRPVGAAVLDWSRAQVAIMRPSASSRALEAILRDLIETRDGASYFAARVWGVTTRYDLDAPHPLAGRSAPDFVWPDGVRLAELLRTGRGLLLDFGDPAPLRTLAERWGDRIAYRAGAPNDTLGLSAVLLRPDGVVAWAADGLPDIEAAAAAAARWFA